MNGWPNQGEQPGRNEESRYEVFEDELVSRLVFRIGGHAIAHDPERVGELIRDPVIYRVPNVPGVFAGLLNRRGRVVPVYDIRHLLPAADAPKTAAGTIEWVLVFHDRDRDREGGEEVDDCVGLVIDEMPLRLRMAPAPRAAVERMAELFRPWCLRTHEREGVSYGELDMAGMMESIRVGAGPDEQGGVDDTVADQEPEPAGDNAAGLSTEGVSAPSMVSGRPDDLDGNGEDK